MDDDNDNENGDGYYPDKLFIGQEGENAVFLRKLVNKISENEAEWRFAYSKYHNERGREKIDKPTRLDKFFSGKDFDLEDKTVQKVITEVKKAMMLLDKYSTPWASLRYMAQMNSDVFLPSVALAFATMLRNPNAVAHESSAATAIMEEEVIQDLATMIGFPKDKTNAYVGGSNSRQNISFTASGPFGYLTADGTLANIDALMLMRDLKAFPLAVKKFLLAGADCEPTNDSKVGHGLHKLEEEFSDGDPRKTKIVEDISKLEQVLSMDDKDLLNMKLSDILNLVSAVADLGKLNNVLKYSIKKFGLKDMDLGVVLVSSARHYSVSKAMSVLGMGTGSLVEVPVDWNYRMDVTELEKKLEELRVQGKRVLAVIGIVGTTEEGAVDDIAKIVNLRKEYSRNGFHFFIHVDAAYGGYFRDYFNEGYEPRDEREKYLKNSFDAIKDCDTVTIDPHKRLYVPYSVGGLVVADRRMMMPSLQKAPYILPRNSFELTERSIGSMTLEGTRSGAMIASVWVAHRLLLHTGIFRKMVEIGRANARKLNRTLEELNGRKVEDEEIICRALVNPPDLDIVNYAFNFKGNHSLDVMNKLNDLIVKFYNTALEPPEYLSFLNKDFVLASNTLDREQYGNIPEEFMSDMGIVGSGEDGKGSMEEWKEAEGLKVIRSVYMHPWELPDALMEEFKNSLKKVIGESIYGIKQEEHLRKFAEAKGLKVDPIFHGKNVTNARNARRVEDEPDAEIIKVVLFKRAGSTDSPEKWIGVMVLGEKHVDEDKVKEFINKESNKSGIDHGGSIELVGDEELKKEKLRQGGVSPLYLAEKNMTILIDNELYNKDKVIASYGSPYVGMKFSPKEFVKQFKPVVKDIYVGDFAKQIT